MIHKFKSQLQKLNLKNPKFIGVVALSIITVVFLILALSTEINNPAIQHEKDNPPNGMIFKGLGERKTAGKCKGMFEIKVNNKNSICTHGPDPAPSGVDVRKRQGPLVNTNQKTSTSHKKQDVAGITCNGDGKSGRRVQALYVRASDREDNYDKYLNSFKSWAATIDQQVTYSAAQTGGHRFIRYVTDSNCELIIENVVLSPEGDDTFDATLNELSKKGYNKNDRKYLIWRDANIVCGLGTLQNDDKPGLDNLSNILTGYALMDNGCWGLKNGEAEIHELAHVLGAVQNTAPHNTGEGHCTDPSDNMCRLTDTAKGKVSQICPQSNEFLFDCNHDDYFSTNPQEGNYLTTHWNMANSEYLGGDDDKRPKFVPSSIADMFIVNRQGGAGKTEIHALSASSDFKDFSIHAASGLHATMGNDWSFALGAFYDDDNLPDIYAINRNGASGKTEVHVLSGKSNFADFVLQTATGLETTTSENWVFDVGNGPDDDPRADLFAINKQGASGKTEVHILQGGTDKDYKDFSLHVATELHATDKNWDFVLGSFSDNFGAGSDIYAINRKGGSGKTEVHILSAESNYKDFILHAVTSLEATDNSNWSFTTGYFDNDLKADLYAINRNGASGKTEVHVLSAASDFKDFIVHAVTGLEATNKTNWTFPPTQDFSGSSSPQPTATSAPKPTEMPGVTVKPTATIEPNQPKPTFFCAGSPNSICNPTTTPGVIANPTKSPTPIITKEPVITGSPTITPTITPNPTDPCLSPQDPGFVQKILDWVNTLKQNINQLIQGLLGNHYNDSPIITPPCIVGK